MHSRTRLRFISIGCLLIAAFTAKELSAQESTDWWTKQTQWNGFTQRHVQIAGRNAYVVLPKKHAQGKPWVWRARFPGFHTGADIKLVQRGYAIGYVDVGGMFGSPKAMAIGDAFYEFMTVQRGFASKPVMEGVSRGGLFVYNWTARHTDRVACIYCDTPVCDFKSWPLGNGSGVGSAGAWKQCLAAYGFDQQQAEAFQGNPLDHASIVAKHKIPLLHIVSENDRVVPPAENTYRLKALIEKAGHKMDVISVPEGTQKSNGHHFTHPAVDRVVDFITAHSRLAG